jgi:NAD(P)-dependent dehydrogenase (short-subunit alcohol dehydrogenase family)
MRLKDKVIIVTGSTTGIGKAIALRCAREGAKVIIHGLENEWGEVVVEEIGRDKSALHIQNLEEEDCAQNLVKLAMDQFGRIDAVVNNAAWVISSDFEEVDQSFLAKVLAINTIAPLMLIRAALPHLKAAGGNVLNIGSVNAWSGEPNLLAYSISKGGLMTMTRNLGDSLFRDHRVRVNQINPGWVLTETEKERKKGHGLSDNWYEDLPAMYAPAGRILWPEEIAAAAVFWLSDECGPVSGQVMELEQYPLIGRNAPKDGSTIQ